MVILKKCPFCSGYAFVLTFEFGSNLIECKNCRCRTDYYTTEQKAVEAWNKRVDDK